MSWPRSSPYRGSLLLIVLLPLIRLSKSNAEGQPRLPLDQNPMEQLLGCPHPATSSPVAGRSPLSKPDVVEKLLLTINQIIWGHPWVAQRFQR